MAQRYESDRTFKEKLELEKEKLSGMTFPEKMSYIWTYYKPVFAGFVALICIIGMGVEIYHNSKIVDVLKVGAVNCYVEDGAKGMEQQLLEILGTGDPYEQVSVDCTYTFGENMEEADYNIVTKFTTIIMAGDMDVLICPSHVYEYYKGDTFMTDLSTLFSEEECEKYGIEAGDDYLDITDSPYFQEFGLTQYEPVYLIVVVSGQGQENAARFIQYIEEGTIDG